MSHTARRNAHRVTTLLLFVLCLGALLCPTFLAGLSSDPIPRAFLPCVIWGAREQPTPSPTPTQTPWFSNCVWNWNTQALPELSTQLQTAMVAAGLDGVTASAMAFGEDCIDPETDEVVYFATMQTDFYVTLAVPTLADLDALGDLAERVLVVLDGFPPGTVPGPQLGYLALTFEAGDQDIRLWFRLSVAQDARRRGLHGQALLEALGYISPEPSPTPTFTPIHFTIAMEPSEQTFPAGASVSFDLSVPEWIGSPWPMPRWSVDDPPAGTTTDLLDRAAPSYRVLVVHTSCSILPGPYTLRVEAIIGQDRQAREVPLQVLSPLVTSSHGSYSGSFTENTITVNRGGPSTMKYGPYLPLQFCQGGEWSMLRVVIESATSEAGTPLLDPPPFSLFHSLVWPAPAHIQTQTGGYRANAREVAHNEGWQLEWTITDGLYVLVFERSPLDASRPPEARPATLTYRVELVP